MLIKNGVNRLFSQMRINLTIFGFDKCQNIWKKGNKKIDL